MPFPSPLMSTAAKAHRHLPMQGSLRRMQYLLKRRCISWWPRSWDPWGSQSGPQPRLQSEPRPIRVYNGQAEGRICPLTPGLLGLRAFVTTSGYYFWKCDLPSEHCLQTCWLLSHSATMHIWSKQSETIYFHTVPAKECV